MNVSFNRNFHKMYTMFSLLLSRPPSNDYHKVVNLYVDVCQFYKNSEKNTFFRIAYKTMFSNTNLLKKCPQLKVSYTYIFNYL